MSSTSCVESGVVIQNPWPSVMFNGSDVRALVARSASGLRWACLSASRHDVHNFLNCRTLGHDIVLFNSCGHRPCQISGKRL
jgi:hypothetical protein